MPKQIGWSNESNLLYTISSQISRLAGVIAASGGGGGGGTITGGGASGQVTFWDAATNITGSNNLFWNNTNGNLGINTTVAPAANGKGLSIYASDFPRISMRNSTTGDTASAGMSFYMVNRNMFYDIQGQNNHSWVSNATERMRLSGATGNLLIQNGGTFTDDNTNILQVTGNARITGNLNVTGENINLGSGTSSVSFISGYNNSFIGNRLILYSTATNLRGIYAGGQGWILSKSSGLADLYPTAIFAIDSTNQGFLPPRMTEAQRNAIVSPAAGLTIYNTTVNDLEVYNGSTWVNDGATVITNRQTVSYTLALSDRGKLVETNVGAANTITVPPNSSITFPIGTKIDIAQYGAGQTTIVPGIGVTVRSAGGALKLSAQYSGATIVKIGTDEWYLFGDITV